MADEKGKGGEPTKRLTLAGLVAAALSPLALLPCKGESDQELLWQ